MSFISVLTRREERTHFQRHALALELTVWSEELQYSPGNTPGEHVPSTELNF